MGIFVIAKYHCEVAGASTDSVDYQVRYFEHGSPDEIEARLIAERPQEYKNLAGETARWPFDEIVAVEIDPILGDGEEIIGFITGTPPEKQT
jgi:hypothetical protein